MATRADIGNALDSLEETVKRQSLLLTQQYRDAAATHYQFSLIKQAVDTPARARAQLQAWIDDYNARNGANTAGSFLNSCLTAAGSTKTVTDVNNELAALETQAQTVVDGVNNNGWTWDQVADWMEANISVETEEEFTYNRLPIPPGYTTVWGDPW